MWIWHEHRLVFLLMFVETWNLYYLHAMFYVKNFISSSNFHDTASDRNEWLEEIKGNFLSIVFIVVVVFMLSDENDCSRRIPSMDCYWLRFYSVVPAITNCNKTTNKTTPEQRRFNWFSQQWDKHSGGGGCFAYIVTMVNVC